MSLFNIQKQYLEITINLYLSDSHYKDIPKPFIPYHP